MPRTIWKGAISFGLVSIPIAVVAATEDRSVRFHQYHVADGARVRTRKVCELDGQELGADEIGKAYEASKDTLIAVTDDELDQMPLPTARAIEILTFVPADSIDPVRISDSYYLAADGQVAAKPYVLLRRALERSSKIAVAKFAWHGRERLGLVQVKGEALVLHSMRWPDEIRDPAALAPTSSEKLGKAEVDRAIALMDEMTTEPEALADLTDHYRLALDVLSTEVGDSDHWRVFLNE